MPNVSKHFEAGILQGCVYMIVLTSQLGNLTKMMYVRVLSMAWKVLFVNSQKEYTQTRQ